MDDAVKFPLPEVVQHKKPENLLAIYDTEISLEHILSATPGYIYWKNVDSIYLGCNEEFLKVALTDELTTDNLIENIKKVIGKTDYDLLWGIDPEIVAKYREDDKYVTRTGHSLVTEDNLVVKNSNGLTIMVRTEKKPLYNKRGDIVGVLCMSVDITEQKEAERLRVESERQKIALKENQEDFANLARKVAHDIQSPLFALRTLIELSKELPEDQRLLLIRATDSIIDISNTLIDNRHKEKNQAPIEVESRQAILVSDLLVQLLSEKKMQYRNRALRFELKVADEAQFAFIDAQRMELRRSLSNLINNAVDASTKKAEGVITLRLMADTKSVDLMIIDQGQGMPDDALEKIRNKHSFTEGKKDGHGIGLQQVWDMLDHNQGSMAVESILHKGTCFHLSFPSIPAPDWMMQTIHLPMNSIIVILDDDDSIHTAWDLRFGSVLASHTTLEVHHFMQGNDAIHFLSNLSPQNKERVVLFSDYELLRQERNGLQVIEASQPKHATLVTSYYASFDVRDAAMKLGVKILPKQMAPVVPIYVA